MHASPTEAATPERPELETEAVSEERAVDWINLLFIAAVHVAAIGAIVYMAAVHFSWWTVALGITWYILCGLGITGGYHRLFSHPTYTASTPLRALFLLFGGASFQNSALKWSSDHRRHHARTDTKLDPYNINEGFWWAHIGWVLFKGPMDDLFAVRDLEHSRLVRFQHRFYLPLAIAVGFLVPMAIGTLWGDPWGALLVAGFLRLTAQWHATFAINSMAHKVGSRPYGEGCSARDSFWTALVTFGEGYHSFHHRFPMDYRNGIRWWHPDPTKWLIWASSKLGLAKGLRRTSAARIQSVRSSK